MKTDTELQKDVRAELQWEPSIHAAGIGVAVKDGVVTLAGEVSSLPEKWAAQSAVQRVAGVRALVIALTVKLSEFGLRTDADIARSAETALSWRTPTACDPISVMVERGWITLTGTTEWQYQREAAANAVSHLVGVLGVNNQIALEPGPPDSSLRHHIEASLARVAKVDAVPISVAVQGPEVTLSGVVDHWATRDLAMRCAWAAPGVRNVVDNMAIAG